MFLFDLKKFRSSFIRSHIYPTKNGINSVHSSPTITVLERADLLRFDIEKNEVTKLCFVFVSISMPLLSQGPLNVANNVMVILWPSLSLLLKYLRSTRLHMGAG